MATYLTCNFARYCHVDVQRLYYRVPYPHAGQTVDLRLTGSRIEVLHHDQRIAQHRRAPPSQRFVSDPTHIPAHHQAFRDPKIMQRAAGIGPATAALIEALFVERRHPEQVIGSAKACSHWPVTTALSPWRPPACERWRSMPSATAMCAAC